MAFARTPLSGAQGRRLGRRDELVETHATVKDRDAVAPGGVRRLLECLVELVPLCCQVGNFAGVGEGAGLADEGDRALGAEL